MGTPFDEIEDSAMVTIVDYKIDRLAQLDPEILQTYLDGFLIRSIPKFTNCMQDLNYDLSLREFDADLSYIEIEILSILFNIEWMTRETQDVTQFQGKLSNREFKTHSESQNLKEKLNYLDHNREKVNQLIVDYQSSPDNLKKLLSW